ncbi:hypothetical protein EMPS_04023 [Entomortierella parvispora]|uniref:Inhibitor I9 domain-containing protein n=1 Tax=Entomortierella parvispora TaxID=205924 RepID=A0A9P3H7X3_9FUNG|nr:hypothetical protein EMPS_04023 [Entomortierella parvispora]
MSSHSHNHAHGHGGHGHAHPTNSTSHETVANALSASVLPVGTTNPGDSVAHSLATAPGSAPSIIPSTALASANGVNKVIVVFKAQTPLSEIEGAIKDVESKGGKVTQKYTSALLGFVCEIPDNAVQTLTVHPRVDYVEPDGEVSIYTKNILAGK